MVEQLSGFHRPRGNPQGINPEAWRATAVKPERNYAKVGYSMIVVAASLAAIGLLGVAIGEDVLFGDNIQRANTAHFNECKAADFEPEGCEKYLDRINTPVSGVYVDTGR